MSQSGSSVTFTLNACKATALDSFLVCPQVFLFVPGGIFLLEKDYKV